jgi:restriction system protein
MQFSPAEAFLNGMAHIWFVWLILGLVLIGRAVSSLLKQQKLARSGIADIDKMDGKTFEKYLKVFFGKLGYKVERTRSIGDYGADLVATNNGVKTAIQAKRYKRRVGTEAVQEAVASRGYYNCDKAMVVTNSCFTNQAKTLAWRKKVELWDRSILVKNLLEIKNSEEASKLRPAAK